MMDRKGKRPGTPVVRRAGGINASSDEIARAIFSAVDPPGTSKRVRKQRASESNISRACNPIDKMADRHSNEIPNGVAQ